MKQIIFLGVASLVLVASIMTSVVSLLQTANAISTASSHTHGVINDNKDHLNAGSTSNNDGSHFNAGCVSNSNNDKGINCHTNTH